MEAKTNTFLETEKSVGTAVTLCIIVSLVLTAVYFIFRHPILVMFGGEVNQETYACAKDYFYYNGNTVLYVWTGHEPDHSF